jgi:hypothetical protein
MVMSPRQTVRSAALGNKKAAADAPQPVNKTRDRKGYALWTGALRKGNFFATAFGVMKSVRDIESALLSLKIFLKQNEFTPAVEFVSRKVSLKFYNSLRECLKAFGALP